MSLEGGGPHGTPEKAVETPLGLHFENHGLIPYMISLSTIQPDGTSYLKLSIYPLPDKNATVPQV